jgi:Fe-S-cluster-containing hydrogenase component 2
VKALVRKSLFADPEKCTGCGICELVCSAFHERKFGLRKSRIRSVKIGETIRMPLTCRLCDKPPCVLVCPTEALKQNVNTGIIMVNEGKCNGCGWCVQSCPFGVMLFHPAKGLPITCDLCAGDPLCVKNCPKEALELTTLDALASKVRKLEAMEMIKEMIKA